jgi:dynein heavy chain 2|eukprot:COSAG06_NODE_10748_length_1624_cov_1.411803_2_plen_99_part_00
MQWIVSSTPEVEWPQQARMSAFQKLLFLQACRSDRLETGMSVFAAEVLGHATVSQAAPSLARVYEETISTEPILLVTTAGSDPSVELEDFARRCMGKL